MVMIALGSLLIGAVLGTRLRVKALFPAIILGLVIVATVAVFKGSSMSSAGMAAIILMICLQVGYLIGLFGRFIMVSSRVASHRSLHSTTTVKS